MSSEARLTQIIDNRIAVAERWHGLTTDEEIVDFLDRDPDLDALLLDTREGQAFLIRLVIEQVVAGVNLDKIRKRVGDEIVDAIIAIERRLRGGEA
jgi:hypothetical protein